ncbi:MAG: ferritin family protein [Candidatus Aminicenantes bacterium]|nr:ferritin family protein [Candidatus Aminicenantes bacterium]MDH5704792.1 ferritin family protein [Candidatus Aminicenantes bacterium]
MEEMSKQVENAIKEAICLEVNGRNFFNHAAEITHNELGKKMFHKLAAEETKHIQAFSKLFSEILKETDWKKFVRDEELKGESALIEKLKERMKGAEGKSETQALSIGMELEEDAIRFFQKAAEEVGDPVAKEIFLSISEEEKFHYDLLQAQHDSLTNSGFWLDSAEFQMDGKY